MSGSNAFINLGRPEHSKHGFLQSRTSSSALTSGLHAQFVVLEKKCPRSPLDSKIKPVSPFAGRRVNLWATREAPILKKIDPEYSLEGLMLKLKLQYFGHLMQRADSLEKTLMLGKTENRRTRWQKRRLNSIPSSMDMNLSKLWDREAWHAAVHGVAKSKTRLSNWTHWGKHNYKKTSPNCK